MCLLLQVPIINGFRMLKEWMGWRIMFTAINKKWARLESLTKGFSLLPKTMQIQQLYLTQFVLFFVLPFLNVYFLNHFFLSLSLFLCYLSIQPFAKFIFSVFSCSRTMITLKIYSLYNDGKTNQRSKDNQFELK